MENETVGWEMVGCRAQLLKELISSATSEADITSVLQSWSSERYQKGSPVWRLTQHKGRLLWTIKPLQQMLAGKDIALDPPNKVYLTVVYGISTIQSD